MPGCLQCLQEEGGYGEWLFLSLQREQKIKDISVLFVNMHHLINEFRPHQVSGCGYFPGISGSSIALQQLIN